ncbi:MAG: hypothetical protein CME19_02330 [Gemmatimonadetes bacterium]|nr:hypothetical protein [Gemmatimonadota bacterium]|tara:strand:+ start:306 stop:614 length:309 start_codon:yes stop_codon:yes gene_type:complete
MDWLLLGLITAFVLWAFQMIVGYRRQIERHDDQILLVQTNTEEVSSQVEKYEADHSEKKEELDNLRKQAEDLEGKEKELDEKITSLKGANEGRRPKRFWPEG